MKIVFKISLFLLVFTFNMHSSLSGETKIGLDPYYPGVYNTSPIISRTSEPSSLYSSPVITPRNSMYHSSYDSNVKIIPTCPCAASVRCQPCSGLYLSPKIEECPCAPKPNCPVCPPLSLIHKIAAKKVKIRYKTYNQAEQDARVAINVSNITFKLNHYLKTISKLSTHVVKLESEANTAARKMEEAFIKAQIARQKMIQVSSQDLREFCYVICY